MKLLLKPLLQQGITPDRERLSDVQVRGSVFILDGVEYDFGRMQPGGYLLRRHTMIRHSLIFASWTATACTCTTSTR